MAETTATIDKQLLDILRCPVAVHYKDKGDDPGQLELVRDTWLYCADSGYKYPIIDGIPKMLAEEGIRWKDTAIEDLPVPPPNDAPPSVAEEALSPDMQALANKFSQTAASARNGSREQLIKAANTIRAEAQEAHGDGVLNRRAEEIASELDAAANRLQGESPLASSSTPPIWQIAGLFLAGMFIGRLLKRNRKQHR